MSVDASTSAAPVIAPARRDVIGVLGGMGPAATADFYSKLVALTAAKRDQDHPTVVIWSDPTVPDRTLALLGEGPDPTDWLTRGARTLAEAGATVLAVPCNTAHAFLPGIADEVGLPLIHMIDEVARHLEGVPQVRRVGLLATTGTVRAGLYQDWLGRAGVDVLVPDAELQDRAVMAAIRAVKAGQVGPATTDLLAATAHALVDEGAEALVAGCTEVPLGLAAHRSPAPLIDPGVVLARAVLRHVGDIGDMPPTCP